MIPLLITFAISLILSAIGFKNYVWFISIGYGLAVAGCGTYAFLCGAWIPGLMLIIYGLRLLVTLFIVKSELHITRR